MLVVIMYLCCKLQSHYMLKLLKLRGALLGRVEVNGTSSCLKSKIVTVLPEWFPTVLYESNVTHIEQDAIRSIKYEQPHFYQNVVTSTFLLETSTKDKMIYTASTRLILKGKIKKSLFQKISHHILFQLGLLREQKPIMMQQA